MKAARDHSAVVSVAFPKFVEKRYIRPAAPNIFTRCLTEFFQVHEVHFQWDRNGKMSLKISQSGPTEVVTTKALNRHGDCQNIPLKLQWHFHTRASVDTAVKKLHLGIRATYIIKLSFRICSSLSCPYLATVYSKMSLRIYEVRLRVDQRNHSMQKP